MFSEFYQPHLVLMALPYILTVWFFIALFSITSIDKFFERISIPVLFLFSLLNITWLGEIPYAKFSQAYINEWLLRKEFLILLDGAAALILTMFLMYDRNAWKQSLILVFAVLCHTMVLYDYKVSQSVMSGFFYIWYDELIIMTALLQMAASYDGFIDAFRYIRLLLSRRFFYSHSANKNTSTLEKRKVKT